MVGLDGAVLGGDGGALDERQQVALHALAAHVGAEPLGAGADLVDLVQEHDAVLLDRLDRLLNHGVLVQQLVALLDDEDIVGLLHGHAAGLGAPAERLAQDVVQIDHSHARARHARDVEGR